MVRGPVQFGNELKSSSLSKREEILNGFSGDGDAGRAAACAGAERIDASSRAVSRRCVGLLKCAEQAGSGGGEGMHGRHGCAFSCGVERAMRGCSEDGPAARFLHHAGHERVGHGAVMGSVAAAAGRQARIVIGMESGRERPQAEKQNEQDGERAPHLEFMLHEGWIASAWRLSALRYHRFIALQQRNR